MSAKNNGADAIEWAQGQWRCYRNTIQQIPYNIIQILYKYYTNTIQILYKYYIIAIQILHKYYTNTKQYNKRSMVLVHSS